MKYVLVVAAALIAFGTLTVSTSQAEAGWRRGWGPGVHVRVAPRRTWWGPRVYVGPQRYWWWGPRVHVGPRVYVGPRRHWRRW